METKLFPTDTADRTWSEFEASGFSTPVSGVVHRGTNPPACGVPLGGIDTGCLDIEARGLLGYSTIFNSLGPRRGPMNEPFLGMSIGKQTWVMTTLDIGWRKDATWSDIYSRGLFMPVKTASEIHYWGHYPVADMEFVTDAPVSVGMRAWSPFIPGDTAISNINTFGRDAGVNDLTGRIENRNGDWRAEGLGTELREIVSAHFSPDMDPHDAAALFWFVRNSWFFELGLESNARVMICSYEDLVAAPAATVKKLYDFIGHNFPGEQLLPPIHQESAGRGSGLELSEDIERLCKDLLERLAGSAGS